MFLMFYIVEFVSPGRASSKFKGLHFLKRVGVFRTGPSHSKAAKITSGFPDNLMPLTKKIESTLLSKPIPPKHMAI
jgi:hypothetical protein